MERKLLRILCFVAGILINSFGIAFITKAALGTSPISSLPYVLSQRFTLTLGQFTFIMNTGFIVAQIVLLGREFEKRQILQIGVNIVFSWFIDVPEEGAAQLLSLFIGCVILAFGISMEVAPNVLLVPGEGIVKALSKVCQKRFGTVKVIFDSSLISISFVLSFLFFHRLNGLGAGTVISALVVGKMVNICNHLPVIHKISAL